VILSKKVYVFNEIGEEQWISEDHPSTVSAITWSNKNELATACYGRVRFFDIVNKNREAMDKIVDLLIEKETLDGEEFVNILSKFTKIPAKERTPQLLN